TTMWDGLRNASRRPTSSGVKASPPLRRESDSVTDGRRQGWFCPRYSSYMYPASRFVSGKGYGVPVVSFLSFLGTASIRYTRAMEHDASYSLATAGLAAGAPTRCRDTGRL